MVIIRREQLDAMRKGLLEAMSTRLCIRLRQEGVLVHADTTHAIREISELIEDSARLGIIEEEHLFRLLRLRYKASLLIESPLIQSVVIRVLHNLAWSVEKRIAFLEVQVLPRTSVETEGSLRTIPASLCLPTG